MGSFVFSRWYCDFIEDPVFSESLFITLGDKSLSMLMVVSFSWLLSPVGLKPGWQAAVDRAAMILSVLRLSAGR
ncbi:hypothetical protein [Endozoicomonas sp. 8E]|uniref:hypothetical protein n=1 Tax=Endozoicomonas sp. 8E TaxID=3035692 RepID=UPI0029394D80|nr:hypothetical protein [Endozoicomonas sp. 8E]WOG28470.1 hypothetical protein P6910_02105 [Endozoicomonas sp. 8E]